MRRRPQLRLIQNVRPPLREHDDDTTIAITVAALLIAAVGVGLVFFLN